MRTKQLGAALIVGVAGLTAAAGGVSAAATVGAAASHPTVVVHKTAKYGKILFTSADQPLYLYTADKSGKSSCSGTCASDWPPLLRHGKLRAGSGVTGKLGSIKRGKGRQVTISHHPLYTFASDSGGNATGQGDVVGSGTFYVVSPSGKADKK